MLTMLLFRAVSATVQGRLFEAKEVRTTFHISRHLEYTFTFLSLVKIKCNILFLPTIKPIDLSIKLPPL